MPHVSNRLLGLFILSTALGIFLKLIGGLAADTMAVIPCVVAIVGIAWFLGREHFRDYQPQGKKALVFMYAVCALMPVLNLWWSTGINVFEWITFVMLASTLFILTDLPDNSWM